MTGTAREQRGTFTSPRFLSPQNPLPLQASGIRSPGSYLDCLPRPRKVLPFAESSGSLALSCPQAGISPGSSPVSALPEVCTARFQRREGTNSARTISLSAARVWESNNVRDTTLGQPAPCRPCTSSEPPNLILTLLRSERSQAPKAWLGRDPLALRRRQSWKDFCQQRSAAQQGAV